MKKTQELQVIVRIVDKDNQTTDLPKDCICTYSLSLDKIDWQLMEVTKQEAKKYANLPFGEAHKRRLRQSNAIKKLLHKAKVDIMSQIVETKLKIKDYEDKKGN